jgi:hypothetical protein
MPRKTTYVPIREVLQLARQGYNDSSIIKKLKEEGYTPRQINDAFNQAKIKAAADTEEEKMEPSIMTSGEEEVMAPTPAPSSGYEYTGYETGAGGEMPAEQAPLEEYNYPQATQFPTYESRPSTEVIEELAEEIINEKWRDFKTRAGDFGALSKIFEKRLKSLALRMKKQEDMIDRIQSSVLLRVRDYGAELKNLRAEIRALELAFSKILEPLVNNIRKLEEGVAVKELGRLKKKEQEEEKLENIIDRKRKKKR